MTAGASPWQRPLEDRCLPDRPRIGLTSWRRAVRTMVGDPEQLYTLAEEYVDRVRRAGGVPLILPPAPLAAAEEAVRSVDGLVLTGGGDFSPSCYAARDEGVSDDIDHQEDAWDFALVLAARETRVPFLGICRGLQALNLALGGTLHQDICGRESHPPISRVPEEVMAFRHSVTIAGESRLARVLGITERSVNSIHHQAVDRLGAGLVAVAHAPDGTVEGLEYREDCESRHSRGEERVDSEDEGAEPPARSAVEAAVESAPWPALAVQWHPERMDPGRDQRIFDDLVERAAARRGARPDPAPRV